MSKPSRQRALMALRSFRSIAAAARSCRTTARTLFRMTLDDEDVREAYEVCAYRAKGFREFKNARIKSIVMGGTTTQISDDELKIANRFVDAGMDPSHAAGTLHKRINDNQRKERDEAKRDAVANIDAMAAEPMPNAPTAELHTSDRWCTNCMLDRCDDPCEVCSRHTIEVTA